MRKRSRDRIRFAHVDATQSARLLCFQLHRARAFNQQLACFTLRARKLNQRRLDFGFTICAFESDQKLVITTSRIVNSERQDAAADIARLKRVSGSSRELVSIGQRKFELGRFALDHCDIAKSREPKFRIVNRHHCLDVGKKTYFALSDRRRDLTSGPPDARRFAWFQRGFDHGVSIRSVTFRH